MTSKKLLSLVLAVCMVLGCVAPASAVQAGRESAAAAAATEQGGQDLTVRPEQSEEKGGLVNDLLLSGEKTENSIPTLRDENIGSSAQGSEAAEENTFVGDTTATYVGEWEFAPVEDGSLEMESLAEIPIAELPDCVAELKRAGEIYGEKDLVSAFILMEAEPVISTLGTFKSDLSTLTQRLEQKQADMIRNIEAKVLKGAALKVDSQLTYLTNGFSVTVEFGKLAEIALLDGVKSVFLMPMYYPCEVDNTVYVNNYVPYTVSSGEMSGVPTVWKTGYSGEGMTIAILDTGLDLDHPAFAAAPAGAAWDQNAVAVKLATLELNAESRYSAAAGESLSASDVYYNAKVPFMFHYGTDSLDVTHDHDDLGDHGTHVAGISAANAVEGSGVVGMAPDAQIIAMKVFTPTGGASMDDIVAALEDCIMMGVDVVNMSLGSSAGFSDAAYDEVNAIYERIATTEMVVNISAGNDGTSSDNNLWGTDMNLTSAPDNATISSPSTYVNVNSIASVDNNTVLGGAIYVNDVPYMYNDAVDLGIEMMAVLGGSTLEYVMIGGYGEAADFAGLDLTDKIAVVARGGINFSTKLINAEAAGAVGLIVTNNVEGSISSFGMSMVDAETGELPEGVSGKVPAVLVSMATGKVLAEAETKQLTVSRETVAVKDEAGGQVSYFSSWGATPDLRLLPDIAGIGGNVFSCYDGGMYGYMSGTSMSSPQVSGISALVMQYLESKSMGDSDILDALLMSTADPVVDQDTGLEASPRQQGAGLVNALGAVTSEAYITVNGGKPKAELGADADKQGVYRFAFTVHNFSAAAKTYDLSASLLTEAVDPTYALYGLYFMAGYECALDGSVAFSAESVTVPAGGSTEVTVTVTLSDVGKAWLNTYYPNGGYVEGFVHLESTDGGVDLSMPYMGFYGDWTDAALFDTAYWYDNTFWGLSPAGGMMEGSEYYHIVWTALGQDSWLLGMNPYTGAYADASGNVVYDPGNNVVSPNGDGFVDGFEDIYLSLMRNAKELVFTYTDVNTGKEYYGKNYYGDGENYAVNVSKTMYMDSYGQVVPFVHSWYWDSCYDFTDENGNVLPSGTTMNVTVSGKLDYPTAEVETISFPVTVDTEAPVLKGANSVVLDQGNYLVLEITDLSLAYVALLTPNGTTVLGGAYEFTEEDGTYTAVLDITGYGTEFMVALCDYGCNEGYYKVTFTGDANVPELDTDLLYGYRVYDEAIYDDSLYGWVAIDKATAEVTQLSNDMYEYYALTAAEYVDGTIFAVDAGYNFIIVQPGTFFRTVEVCNLGFNVIDMTWDPVGNTMYLVGTGEDEWGDEVGYFCTLDILTGKVTTIATYDSKFDMPYTIACTDDGVIYATRCYYSYLCTVDKKDGTMTRVQDAEGNNIAFKRADGRSASPQYNQSMTYSSEGGCLYWAFFNSSYESELFRITPDAETGTASYTSVAFPVNAEIVGLITLDEDDDYTIPEAEKLSELKLNANSVIMNVGDTAQLSVSCLPWNYELKEDVVWASDNADVVTVDQTGLITGVAEGKATITASCEGVTAQCTVTVVDVKGTVYGYNYYSSSYTSSSWGDWFAVDMADMSYESTVTSEVDFNAADYNGHNGYVYGYDQAANFYRMDPDTGACELLGTASALPNDMAYDYSTGFMYAIVSDSVYWMTTLYYVNMNTGALVEVGSFYDFGVVLACSTEGELYFVDYEGCLFRLDLTDMGDMGGGVMPLATGSNIYIDPVMIMEELPSAYQMQSMCYDHNNDVIVWPCMDDNANCSFLWIDVEGEIAVPLGVPGDRILFEYVGMYSIPEKIPELDYVPVERVSAEDMVVLVGGTKTAAVTVEPLNATNQSFKWTSGDETIATVDENGKVTGVKLGTTTITGTLADGEETYTVSFTVAVKNSSDNIYGYVLTDLATYGGDVWVSIPDSDPTNGVEYLAGSDYTMYSAEYVESDGVLYGYGYDAYDWEAHFQYMTIDPDTYEILDMVDMGSGFPFVYDMTYDYTTGTMYAVAGYNDSSSDLYIVDISTGQLLPCMDVAPFVNAIAADSAGNLYGIAVGEVIGFDWNTLSELYDTAKFYQFDVEKGSCKELFDLGLVYKSLGSMAFDHDNGNLYWTYMNISTGDSGLYMVDIENETAFDLGPIGTMGSQTNSLYILADNYPETPDELLGATMTSDVETMGVGDSVELGVLIQPYGFEADITWESDDEGVATVDENGEVTAVAPGVAYITVTVSDGENTFTDTCKIVVFSADDYLISYNRTENGFYAIDRADPTIVSKLSTDSVETDVTAFDVVDGVIYGYDEAGSFFTINMAKGFTRTYLGEHGMEAVEDASFKVRDMAWDAAYERMLVLGSYWDEYAEMDGSCGIYTVDLSDGTLTAVVTGLSYPDGSGYSYTCALAVDGEGTVYYYSAFADYIGTVDLDDGTVSDITTLQNQSLYGDSAAPMAMVYDGLTEDFYLLFTTNGNMYRLVSYDPARGQAVQIGFVGDVTWDDDNGYYVGDIDLYAGLAVNSVHNHIYGEFEDDENGATHSKKCSCGNKITENHEYTYTIHEDGTHTAACPVCGATVTEVHEYTYVDNGNGTHTGTCACGASVTEEHSYEGGFCVCGDSNFTPIVPAPSIPQQPDIPVPDEPEVPDVTDDMPYTDVDTDDWFYDEVKYTYVNGLMNGVSDTLFAPYADTTRGMIVTILYRLEGSPAVEGGSKFADVASGEWYTDAVIWAAANGIVTGYGDGNFGPLNTITREQLAAIMYRYAAYKGYDVTASADLSIYSDADAVSAYAAAAMSWANAVGLINGRTATTLVPQGSANRAEAATILMRFCQTIVK